MRRRIRAYLPPAVLPWVRRITQEGIWFTGAYPTWAEAAKQAVGYGAQEILEKVTRATEAVQSGEAVCERDSFLFHQRIFPFPILAVLLRAALDHPTMLTVLDFGGSLGSTYRQCEPFLAGLQVEWRVVEQSHFVERGQLRFETESLRFFPSIEAAAVAGPVNVVLLSSVLQYLETPLEILDRLEGVRSPYLVIDRTPFHEGDEDFAAVQHVSPRLYAASYPCWVFSEARMRRHLAGQWGPIEEIPCDEGQIRGGRRPIIFKGFFMKRLPEYP